MSCKYGPWSYFSEYSMAIGGIRIRTILLNIFLVENLGRISFQFLMVIIHEW